MRQSSNTLQVQNTQTVKGINILSVTISDLVTHFSFFQENSENCFKNSDLFGRTETLKFHKTSVVELQIS